MIRMLQILAFLGLIILIIGGVVEVKVHPDQLSNVPGQVVKIATDKILQQSIKAKLIALKRDSEQWLIKDEDKRIELAIAYIKIDTENLNRLIAENEDNAKIVVPQAELLLSSIERTAKLASSASVDKLPHVSQAAKTTVTLAYETLAELNVVKDESKMLNKRLVQVTQLLEEYIGNIIPKSNNSSNKTEVAGSKDPETIQSNPQPAVDEKVPLSF